RGATSCGRSGSPSLCEGAGLMRAVERQARLALLPQAPAALSLSPDRLHGATPQPEGALVSRAADKGRAGVALPSARGETGSREIPSRSRNPVSRAADDRGGRASPSRSQTSTVSLPCVTRWV